MPLPVRVVASGGLPVQLSLTAFGMPVEISTLPGALPVQIVLTGGVPCLDVLGGVFAPGFSLTAPVLDWDDDTTDSTPDFIADLTGPLVDDDIVLEWDNDIDFSSPISTDANIVDAGEALALSVAFAVGSLADGTYYFRAKHGRSGSYSAWSNTETVTILTTFKLLLVAGGTDELLQVDAASKILLAA